MLMLNTPQCGQQGCAEPQSRRASELLDKVHVGYLSVGSWRYLLQALQDSPYADMVPG